MNFSLLSSRQFWRRGFIVLMSGIVSGFIGEWYGDAFYGPDSDDYLRGFRTGFSIGALSAAIEVFYVRGQRRNWLRRTAFIPGLIVRILALTLMVRICLVGNELLTDFLTGRPLKLDFNPGEQTRDTLISMLFVIFFVIITQLTAIIGFKRFINLVVGRYFRPVSEDRAFLFVDLVDSSNLARKLGNERFHNYLSEFFYQLDQAIVRTGGEIVSYVGDAVIVTWPLGLNKRRNARPLASLRSMLSRVENQRVYFEENFGVVPEFRAALHGGSVVVGECGDSRRQVTFLGDVVNMTARLEALTKETGEQFLASQEVLDRMELPLGVETKDFGSRILRGADEPFSLSLIEFSKG